jgi:hypothetical protein
VAGLLVGLVFSFNTVKAVGDETPANEIGAWTNSGYNLVTVPVFGEEQAPASIEAGCSPIPIGAISHWQLDEGAGATTFADSIGGPDGTCSGSACPTAVSGVAAGAQFFINTDTDVITVPSTTAYDWTAVSDFSIGMWVKTTQDCSQSNKVFIGRYRNIVGEGDWWLGCVGSGFPTFKLRDSNGNARQVNGTSIINDGQWHYIVGVRDGIADQNHIYVDGNLETTETSPEFDGNLASTDILTMGSFNAPGDYFYNGALDDVVIFDSVWDPAAYYGTCTFDPVVGDVAFETEQNLALPITSAELYANSEPSVIISSVSSPSAKGGIITGTAPGGPFTYTPPTDFIGTDIFTFVVSDGSNTDQGIALIQVNELQIPVIDPVPDDQINDEGEVISLQIYATDPNDDPLTYSALGLPGDLSIDPVTGLISGTISYTASKNSSYDPVTVTVTDTDTNTTSEDFVWTVNHVNVPPQPTTPPDQVDKEGDTVSLQIQATDPNEDTLTYNAVGLPPGVTINTSTGLISGTILAGASDFSPYSVTVNVDDGEAPPVPVTFDWAISGINHPPQITQPPNQVSTEGDTVSLQIVASDPDEDTLVYNANGLPHGLSINTSTGLISGTILSGTSAFSPYTVTVTVDDGGAAPVSTIFTWTVESPTSPMHYIYLPIVSK